MIFLVTSNNFHMLHSVPTTRYVVLKFDLLYVSKDVTWTIFFTLHVPNFFLYYIYIGKPMHHVLHTPCPEFKACDFRWEQLHGFSFKPPKYICNCPYHISGHGVWSTCLFMSTWARPQERASKHCNSLNGVALLLWSDVLGHSLKSLNVFLLLSPPSLLLSIREKT